MKNKDDQNNEDDREFWNVLGGFFIIFIIVCLVGTFLRDYDYEKENTQQVFYPDSMKNLNCETDLNRIIELCEAGFDMPDLKGSDCVKYVKNTSNMICFTRPSSGGIIYFINDTEINPSNESIRLK